MIPKAMFIFDFFFFFFFFFCEVEKANSEFSPVRLVFSCIQIEYGDLHSTDKIK